MIDSTAFFATLAGVAGIGIAGITYHFSKIMDLQSQFNQRVGQSWVHGFDIGKAVGKRENMMDPRRTSWPIGGF